MHSGKRLSVLLRIAFAASLLFGRTAVAQDALCAVPPLSRWQATPADGALEVARNAVVRVDYPPGSLGDPSAMSDAVDPTWITLTTADGVAIEGTAQRQADSLSFIPAALLQAGASYLAQAIDPNADAPLAIRFTTGDLLDQAPPQLTASPVLGSTTLANACGSGEDGFRIDVSFPPAIDDTSPGSIEYGLTLSRASHLKEPLKVGRARNFASDRLAMSFPLAAQYAQHSICVDLHAVDGLGQRSEEERACIDPFRSLAFDSACQLTPLASSTPAGAWPTAVAFVWGRRRRRVSLRACIVRSICRKRDAAWSVGRL